MLLQRIGLAFDLPIGWILYLRWEIQAYQFCFHQEN